MTGARRARTETQAQPESRKIVALLFVIFLAGLAGLLFIDTFALRLIIAVGTTAITLGLCVVINARLKARVETDRELEPDPEPISQIGPLEEQIKQIDNQLSELVVSLDAGLDARFPKWADQTQGAMRSAAELLELSSVSLWLAEAAGIAAQPVAVYPVDSLTNIPVPEFGEAARRTVLGNDQSLWTIALNSNNRSERLGGIAALSPRPLNSAQETILKDMAQYLGEVLLEADAHGKITSSRQSAARNQILHLAGTEIVKQREFFNSVFQSLTEGVILTGLDGLIQFANQSAVTLLHTTERKLLGRHLLDLLRQSKNWTLTDLREDLLISLTSGQALVREITIRLPLPRYYQVRVAPIRITSGRPTGLIVVFSDITRLKELDQAKNEVMSLVSHELRTPLTAIRGYSELLKETPDLPEGADECVNTIHEAAERLARIITTFLDVSRLESGKQEINATPIKLNEVARAAIHLMRPVAEARNIRLIEDLPQSAPVVPADRDLIAQVITNLISNAIKYSPEHTAVTISVDADLREMRLTVADQGYGIPPESIDKIWEKFYRLDRESDRDTIGTGLGLSFVREIVRKHGGEVFVSSEAGRGSRFGFTLPRI